MAMCPTSNQINTRLRGLVLVGKEGWEHKSRDNYCTPEEQENLREF